jgi:HEAT repeat protein/PBS lyase HEAT-like repeat-containing protein
MLLTAVLCLAWRAPLAGPSSDGLAAVRAVLQRTEGSSQARDDVLVRRLVALGSPAGPALFSLASGESIEALLVDDSPEAWLCPPEAVCALALAALAELPGGPLREHMRTRCAEKGTRELRVTALQVLARQGSPDGLPLWLELCTASGDELEHPSLREPAVVGLAAMLRADGSTARALEEPLLAATPLFQHVACEGLARAGRADGLALLGKLFGREPELDLAVLEGLAQLGERYPWALGDQVAPRLRAALDPKRSPELRTLAAQALGRTRDAQSVPSLIACLEGGGGLARAAQWSLREITGATRPRTTVEWQAWLQAEQDWWKEQGTAKLEALDPAAPEGFSAALRALMAHPLGRDNVADALSTDLGALEPTAQSIACDALGRLGARRAVPMLIELLFSKDESVRAAAWRALRTLTGADLPAEPRLWEEYAFG